MVNVALIGYGQMGKMLEKLSAENDCQIKAIFDPGQELYDLPINEDTLYGVDVCIDFSLPDAVVNNIESVALAGKAMVVGTTGWLDSIGNVENLVRHHDTGLIYSSNFSVGMNLFYRLLEQASKLISTSDLYDVYGLEKHHRLKADSPSGTAKDLTEIIRRHFRSKTSSNYDRLERRIEKGELHFASVRAGSFPGTHSIGFDSPFDTIELTHTARNREGFAVGALKAAQWIAERKGIYDFNDILDRIIAE